MKLAVRLLSLLLAAALMLPVGALAYDNPFVSPRGSCNSIDGVTVLVSIFVNDPVHSWNYDLKADYESYSRIYWRLKTASEWLTWQAQRYQANPRIIWDWHNQPYLYYFYTSDHYLCDQSYTYDELRTYIQKNINLKQIKDYYKADNVIFFAMYNQDINANKGGYAWSWDFNANAGQDYALEIIWITDEDSGLTVSAAGLAHEMMHCFGAIDLYASSSHVPKAYVDHLSAVKSKDIMYTIDYHTPDTIGEVFSDLDAYYMGLLPASLDQERWGLVRTGF